MKRELVIVMDFGGQYNQLVARRVRECNVYCEIYSYKTPLEKIKEMNPKGIILTGGPNSCYLEDSPTYSKELFELDIPVLGLCYGAQLMQHVLGGKVERADVREYGKSILLVDQPQSKILKGVPETSTVWMSHFDYISKIAPGFEITTHTKDCPVASCEDKEKDLYAIQFHPEVLHSEYGKTMLSNFVLDVCNCAGDWRMDSFVEEQIKAIKEAVPELPMIGLWKVWHDDTDVFITPTMKEVKAIWEAGAEIIALDCTAQVTHEGTQAWNLIKEVKKEIPEAIIFADVSNLEEARRAVENGADIVAPTLYGYTKETSHIEGADYRMFAQMCRELKDEAYVMMEGHLYTPEDAMKCIFLGAHSVVVGSAITRPHLTAKRFVDLLSGYQDNWRDAEKAKH